MSFAALYYGTCPACEEPIKPGQSVEWSDRYALVHAGCPEPELSDIDLRPGERVCRLCHLVHPGEC